MSKKISDKKIESKIKIPKNLPIDIDKKSYLKNNVTLIRKELDKGMSLDRAVKKVTGHTPQDTIQKKSRSKTRSLDMNKIIFIVITLMLAIAGVLLYMVNSYKPHTTSAISKPELQGTQQDEMILISGLDTRPLVDDGDGNSQDVPGSRTDMLALVSIPKDGSRATVVSIPRDTSVSRAKCDNYHVDSNSYDDTEVAAEDNVKVNSVYGVGGPRCLVKTLNDNLDIDINRYMEVNFKVFQDVVDSLGGIDITTDQPIIDDTLGTIIDTPGTHTLNGRQALDYVRARKVEGTSKSDLDRIDRQQQFSRAVLDKLFDEGKIKDKKFVTHMIKNVLPNIKQDNIGVNDLAQLGHTLSEMDKKSIKMTTLPILDEDIMGNLIMDEDQTAILFDTLKNNAPIRGDHVNRGSSQVKATIKNISDIKATVVAQSAYDERAQKLKKFIESKGGSVSIVTSNDLPQDSTIYMDKKNYNSVSTMAEMFPNIVISTKETPVKKSSTDSIVLTIGSNADEVFKTHQKNNKGKKYSIDLSFNGMASDMIPREIPGLSD